MYDMRFKKLKIKNGLGFHGLNIMELDYLAENVLSYLEITNSTIDIPGPDSSKTKPVGMRAEWGSTPTILHSSHTLDTHWWMYC